MTHRGVRDEPPRVCEPKRVIFSVWLVSTTLRMISSSLVIDSITQSNAWNQELHKIGFVR